MELKDAQALANQQWFMTQVAAELDGLLLGKNCFQLSGDYLQTSQFVYELSPNRRRNAKSLYTIIKIVADYCVGQYYSIKDIKYHKGEYYFGFKKLNTEFSRYIKENHIVLAFPSFYLDYLKLTDGHAGLAERFNNYFINDRYQGTGVSDEEVLRNNPLYGLLW